MQRWPRSRRNPRVCEERRGTEGRRRGARRHPHACQREGETFREELERSRSSVTMTSASAPSADEAGPEIAKMSIRFVDGKEVKQVEVNDPPP